ncbi:methyltransferas-like protein [Amniculicola lignicola CBS 123094]|uniref:carnosine N-methyltransferase n=1 Tax=Amniculicola lignicola CBS 123094 TaxID=1392246 RepID=A0A6A5W3I1_9PLEO|nr:methyltransferas-like protein [Amniculicola lignicola CBS 123094]
MAASEWKGEFDPMSDPDERKHLLSVLDSFRSYRRLAHFNGTHVRRQAFYSLPQKHWTLLSQPPFSILSSFNKMDDLIDSNAEIAEAIFCTGFKAFLAPTLSSDWVSSIVPETLAHDEFKLFSAIMDKLGVKTTQTDAEKARSTVNQFYREWSSTGSVERTKCFSPILDTLTAEYTLRQKTNPSLDRSDMKVLLPGAGLGRLVLDICLAGYTIEGNEISYHALMASSLILNHTPQAEKYTLAPFALSSSNHLSRSDQFRTYAIPDIHPATELQKAEGLAKVHPYERMSMNTGDFCVVYGKEDEMESFDCVATVFFIDTAPNLIRYIEAVHNCLKPGGLWINLGPLLWHARAPGREDEGDGEERREGDTGIDDPGSVELTNEEVVALVQHFGFVMEKEEMEGIDTGYISNTRSMLQNTYRPVFWVARKI